MTGTLQHWMTVAQPEGFVYLTPFSWTLGILFFFIPFAAFYIGFRKSSIGVMVITFVVGLIVIVGLEIWTDTQWSEELKQTEANYVSQLGGSVSSESGYLKMNKSGVGPEFLWNTGSGVYQCKAYKHPDKELTYATICSGSAVQEAQDIINKASAK